MDWVVVMMRRDTLTEEGGGDKGNRGGGARLAQRPEVPAQGWEFRLQAAGCGKLRVLSLVGGRRSCREVGLSVINLDCAARSLGCPDFGGLWLKVVADVECGVRCRMGQGVRATGCPSQSFLGWLRCDLRSTKVKINVQGRSHGCSPLNDYGGEIQCR